MPFSLTSCSVFSFLNTTLPKVSLLFQGEAQGPHYPALFFSALEKED